ncbi:MAG: HAMP domain-containing histidine kinase [Bacteroidia bacterium]|nr:HAMP domain-containing histidine kinase [Bacteroidia bacterium]
MKLLTRTTLYFAVISLPVFAVGGIILYHTVRTVARNDAHEKLRNEKNMILNYVKKHNYLPHNSMEFGDSVGFTQVSFAQVTETLKDTVLYNFSEKEMEQNLMLVFRVDAGNATYRAVIFKPLIETDDLTNAIFQAMAIAGAILLILLLALSVIVTNKLWGPFYESLQKLKSFDLNKGGRMELSKTGISEFNELNTALKGMTGKIASDYTNLKEFTENASHEIQTPLAIIQSKLELLIQSENLSAEQMDKVLALY